MTEQEATLPEHQASRTLVKSPPELWLACSVQESLARHLQSFGEIRITRLEPETAVAWEGDATSGTVRIEPSGWGTRVTLTARPLAAAQTAEAVQETTSTQPAVTARAVTEPEPPGLHDDQPQPEPEPLEPPAAARGGLWQRLMARLRPASQAEPVAAQPDLPDLPDLPDVSNASDASDLPDAHDLPDVDPDVVEASAVVDPTADPEVDPVAALDAALDSLGQAHHRPFSRG